MNARAVLEERLALMAPARRLRLALADREIAAAVGERPLRMLDAGCGDGLLSLALAKRHPRWSILGVDLRDDMLEGARARARARELRNVEFEHADLERPLEHSGFDVVMAVECLSEIPDDRRAVGTMAAALAPGGVLVVQVPERNWQPVLPGSPDTWREQVRQGYDAGELTALLGSAGLEPVPPRPTYRSLATGAQELRDRIKGRGLAVRAAAFPLLAGAVRLELAGVTWGRANALLAVARRPD